MKFISQGITEVTSTIADKWDPWISSVVYNTSEEDPLPHTAVCKVGNYYYRTLVDNNVGNNPEDTLGTKWMRWGVSNPGAMFDLQSTTKSIAEIPYNYVATDATQVVDIQSGEVVWYTKENESLGLFDSCYMAKVDQAQIDLSLEDFKDHNKWEIAGLDIIVEFKKSVFDTLTLGYYTSSNIHVYNLGPASDEYPTTGEQGVDWVMDLNCKYRQILVEQIVEQSYNEYVDDYYTYMYADYSTAAHKSKMVNIPLIGDVIRVRLTPESITGLTSCGFLVANKAIDMGLTTYGVNFSFNSFSSKETDEFGTINIVKRGVQELVDFETVIKSNSLSTTKSKVKEIYDDIVVFILDPTEESIYDNFITMGTIENVSTVLTNRVESVLSWSIHETI